MRAARAWAFFSGSRSERGKAPAGNGWGAALPCGGIRHFQSRRCVKERRPGFVTGIPRASGRCPSPLPLRAQVYARRETPPDVCGGIRMFFRVLFFCSRVAGCGRRAERWDEAAEHAGKAFGGGTAGRRLPSSVGTARARMRKGIRALRRPGGRVGPAGKGFAKG